LHREEVAIAGAHTEGPRRAGFDPLRRPRIDRVGEARGRIHEGPSILRGRFDRTAKPAEDPLENALRGRWRGKAKRQQANS
jgi:hypothetical protein